MDTCRICSTTLDERRAVTCSGSCGMSFHFACVGMTKSQHSSWTAKIGLLWFCATCRLNFDPAVYAREKTIIKALRELLIRTDSMDTRLGNYGENLRTINKTLYGNQSSKNRNSNHQSTFLQSIDDLNLDDTIDDPINRSRSGDETSLFEVLDEVNASIAHIPDRSTLRSGKRVQIVSDRPGTSGNLPNRTPRIDVSTPAASSQQSKSVTVSKPSTSRGNTPSTQQSPSIRSTGKDGSGSDVGGLRVANANGSQTASDTESFYVTPFEPDQSEEDVKNHVIDVSNLHPSLITVNKLVPRGRQIEDLSFVSFKVTVCKTASSVVGDSWYWPQGISVRQFEPKAKKRIRCSSSEYAINFHPHLGRTTFSTMEVPEPTLTVQTIQPAIISRPSPVLGLGEGVFQPVLPGKYKQHKNFFRSENIPSDSLSAANKSLIQSSPTSYLTQRTYGNHLPPGRTSLSAMEAPEPILTVQTVQPALFSRPGPVPGSGDGVFQPALSGKYFLPMNISRSDIVGTRSSSDNVGNIHPEYGHDAEVFQPVPSSSGSIVAAPGCAPASLMEAPNPLISVEPFLPASYSHPGPEFEHGEGVFQPVSAGKYAFRLNYCVPDPCKISSQSLHYRFKINNCEPAPSQQSSQLVYCSHSSPGVPAPGCMPASSMEAPNPLISVEPVLPASCSHPGPEYEHGEGVFQTALAGEKISHRACTSSDRLSTPSASIESLDTNIARSQERSTEVSNHRSPSSRDVSTPPAGHTIPSIPSEDSKPVECRAGCPLSAPLRRYVTVYYQNVRGMRTKTADFFLSTVACDYDIIIITETWLHPDILNSELSSHYTIFRCDRSDLTSPFQRGGGVLIAVKSSLRCTSVSLDGCDTLEQVAVTVKFPDSTIHFCCIYIRPTSTPEVYSTHASAVQQICSRSSESDGIVVLGDYNLPRLSWLYDDELNSYLPSNASSEAETTFTESMIATGLHQVNSLRNVNDNILDLAFVSDACDVELIEPPSSLLRIDPHHKPFVLRIEINDKRHLPSPDSTDELDFDFFRCDFTSLNRILSSIDWLQLLENESTDNATVIFYDKLYEVLRYNAPRRQRRSLNVTTKLPWWSPELRNLRNVVRKARKRFIRSKSRENRAKLESLESRYSSCLSSTFRTYINRTESNLKMNPSNFWSFVRSRKSNNRIPEQMNHNGTSAKTIKESADLFADFFSSVHSASSATLSAATRQRIPRHDISFPLFNITEQDVESELSKLDVNKGAGTDRLPPIFLKECAESLKLPISLIFNQSLTERKFPSIWKIASIVPIHKSGSYSSVENYRGISILCCVAKVFEGIVHPVLYNAIRHLISACQHGFVKKRSTVSNLMCYTNFLSKNIEDRQQVDAVYFDFSKAFDKVPHGLAIEKLEHMGLPSWITEWIRSYLSDRNAFVKLGNSRSRVFSLTSGVPQGSILGPLIFVLFVNDLANRLKSSKLLYADDLKIYRVISSALDSCALQSDIDELLLWCSENGMQLNIKKCKSITFTRRQSTLTFEYKIGGTSIDRVSSINDLGVIVDSKLKFNEHVNVTTAKAYSILGFVRRNSQSFQDVYTLKTLYCSLVRSILEYAACVWSPYYTTLAIRIERVQRSFIRYALRSLPWNDPSNLPDYESRCKLIDLEPLSTRRTNIKRMFIFDLLTNNVDCAALLSELSFSAPARHLRGRHLLVTNVHRTTYGQNSPLSSCIQCFNVVNDVFDFNVSKIAFKRSIKNIR